MPFVHVYAAEGTPLARKRALARDLTEAVCEAYDIPAAIVTLYFVDIPPDCYAHAGELGPGDAPARPLVVIQAFERPIEARRKLVEGVNRAVADALGLSAELPAIYLHDSPRSHVAHGGVLVADAEARG
jgi:phenylpyruvate tautomerase PptA (4-oxalocrotonate tautomerase family)